jgi:4-diphosphocytidyl-2-C-methyl-D-erythritol kinase
MITFPHCKFNLGLNVKFKREDGFHEIETIMVPLPFKDILEIVPAPNFQFNSSGISIPGDKNDNLCVKAYNLFQRDFQIPTVAIHLHKNIPLGAGLGGGSSNGSFTLVMLNELFDLKITNQILKQYAALLGSDCPFFIDNKIQLCTGRGEITNELSLDLSSFFVKLINPNLHVNTSEAYANLDLTKPSNTLEDIIARPLGDWKKSLKNDFEDSVFKKYPILAVIKNKLYEEGALYASMSGSGSTMIALFKTEPKLSFRDFGLEKIIQL